MEPDLIGQEKLLTTDKSTLVAALPQWSLTL